MFGKNQRKVRFSLSTLFLLTTVVAFAIVSVRSVSTIWRLRHELRIANQTVQQLRDNASSRNDRIQAEFFGHHGEPVLAIDPRAPKCKPSLLRILNSKSNGQGGVFRWGSPAGGTLQMRQVMVDLRLLRSLDGIDYYRLEYVGSAKATAPDEPVKNAQKVLLFQYNGNARLLVDENSLVIAIAPDRESCIETVIGAYDPRDAEELHLAWQAGPYKPTVQTMFYPAVRSILTDEQSGEREGSAQSVMNSGSSPRPPLP